jgi:hypothetical protein
MVDPDPPEQAYEDTDIAWGDETEADADDDDRLEQERPPHHDR